VALVEKVSVDGQSTFGSSEANGLNFADEMQSKMDVCINRCTQFEDLLERHLNNITQVLKRLDQNVQIANSVSARQGKYNIKG
jgi:hypothetical protein